MLAVEGAPPPKHALAPTRTAPTPVKARAPEAGSPSAGAPQALPPVLASPESAQRRVASPLSVAFSPPPAAAVPTMGAMSPSSPLGRSWPATGDAVSRNVASTSVLPRGSIVPPQLPGVYSPVQSSPLPSRAGTPHGMHQHTAASASPAKGKPSRRTSKGARKRRKARTASAPATRPAAKGSGLKVIACSTTVNAPLVPVHSDAGGAREPDHAALIEALRAERAALAELLGAAAAALERPMLRAALEQGMATIGEREREAARYVPMHAPKPSGAAATSVRDADDALVDARTHIRAALERVSALEPGIAGLARAHDRSLRFEAPQVPALPSPAPSSPAAKAPLPPVTAHAPNNVVAAVLDDLISIVVNMHEEEDDDADSLAGADDETLVDKIPESTDTAPAGETAAAAAAPDDTAAAAAAPGDTAAAADRTAAA